jgi:hypothetical protein
LKKNEYKLYLLSNLVQVSAEIVGKP